MGKRLNGAAGFSAVVAASLLGAVPASATDHVGCITCEPTTGRTNALMKIQTGPGEADAAFSKHLEGPAFGKLSAVFDKLGVVGPFWKYS